MFASDLEQFDLADLEAATKAIAQRPRAEGETAFPEIATIVAEVTRAARTRRIAEDRKERTETEAREAERRRDHPEEFEPFTAEDFEKLSEKFGEKFSFERPKPKPVIEPQLTNCPGCNLELPISSNIRFWTSQEMREMADIKERHEKLAEANRELVHHCIEEQLSPSTPVPSVGDFDEVQA